MAIRPDVGVLKIDRMSTLTFGSDNEGLPVIVAPAAIPRPLALSALSFAIRRHVDVLFVERWPRMHDFFARFDATKDELRSTFSRGLAGRICSRFTHGGLLHL